MTTLVIHPKDPTTDFLIPIYSNLKECTVIRGGISKDAVRELIKKHDRIIMMGHGSPSGLFAVGQFEDGGLIIDHTMVETLRRKKESLYIWCNADQFIERFNLRGFYTGMFISEYGEAAYCNVPTRVGEVERSNDLFAQIVGRNINENVEKIWRRAKRAYVVPDNKVSEYNNSRLYLKD